MKKDARTTQPSRWGDATKLVRGGLDRSPHGETSEALFLNSGFVYDEPETAERRLARHPDRILRDAVRRMLPKNKLAFKMIQRLKIYAGPDHPHQAQEPEARELGVK